MAGRYFRRRWDETRGDEFDGWGHSVWYFEVDDDGWPVRQVQEYDTGPVLRYGPGHCDDRYGSLGQTAIDEVAEGWGSYRIDRDEFERAWRSAGDRQSGGQ